MKFRCNYRLVRLRNKFAIYLQTYTSLKCWRSCKNSIAFEIYSMLQFYKNIVNLLYCCKSSTKLLQNSKFSLVLFIKVYYSVLIGKVKSFRISSYISKRGPYSFLVFTFSIRISEHIFICFISTFYIKLWHTVLKALHATDRSKS